MLVLRRSADVVRSLVDGTHFAMAGLTGTGELRGSPLTGAEMQSPRSSYPLVQAWVA